MSDASDGSPVPDDEADHDIRALDERTVQRIAAGEVVERPASVVKELVENSLDADASRVSVAVDGDGTEAIRVRDDGEGMSESALRVAVEEHTTSKIATIDDLEAGVGTLGFRGEALHTIGAVSRLSIRSKPRGGERGTELRYEGGELIEVRPAGCPEGTVVEVDDLFYNTPARRKFLKTAATEFDHVNRVVTHYALANPGVAVSLEHDGREVFATEGRGSLQSAVLSVYGRDVAESLVHVDSSADDATDSGAKDGEAGGTKDGEVGREEDDEAGDTGVGDAGANGDSGGSHADRISVSGFVSHPETTRSTREYLSTFVNGRYVTAAPLREAVLDAYGGQLANDRYPFAVLFVEVPADAVDVNVHPRKMEVRFDDERGVRRAVETSVESALVEHGLVRSGAPRGRSAPDETELRPEPSESMGAEGVEGSKESKGSKGSKGVEGTNSRTAESAESTEPAESTAPESTPAETTTADSTARGETASPAEDESTETDESTTSSSGSVSTAREGEASTATSTASDDAESASASTSTSAVDPVDPADRPSQWPQRSPTETDEGAGSASSETDRSTADATGDEADTGRPTGIAGLSTQRTLDGDAVDRETDFERLPRMRVLGQIHETYIVAETADGLVLVDQHAADERVNYERLAREFEGETPTQALASPVELELTAREAALFEEYREALARVGFHAGRVGERRVEVRTVPAVFDATLDPDLLRDALAGFVADERDGGRDTVDAVADDLLADLACYPSITGNTSLTEGSVVDLLEALDGCENPYACPHGRPVVIRFDRDEIEDRFERDYPGHGGRRRE